MEKLREFGIRAMFYARVLSGYEERRIRSYRLQIQQRLAKAEERKSALKKIPEQIILSEVRRMVEEMQSLNKKLEETEAAIDEYFSPLDKEAEMIVKMQLEGEEKSMKEMVKTMQMQAMLEKEEAEKIANVRDADAKQLIETESSPNPPDVAK
ncbi:putative Golgin subfamily A member 6-like protein 4 [Heracleum sosnowskyi]|uniref:Golgin subfamily A member 6-like protein 4 n=1 Tax=Heracleum sosnowskyi TaxID=360622 RepID=A0AAD8HXY7_9APIA|nr:putative Golgin subfamily A member 6-like protein 4 [Heracleum sosnowskyi]